MADVAKSAQHPHSGLKTQKELKKITDSKEYKKSDYADKTKMLGGKTSAVTKKNKPKRVGKQFGGGLPTQPVVGANLPVGANPMGVAAGVGAPGRRFGMKHGSKKSREKKSTGGRVGYSDGGQVRPDGGWTD